MLISSDFIIEPDLLIENGDILVGNSDNFNIQYISYAQKGQFYSYPNLGVGIANFINDATSDGRVVRREIRLELDKDGYSLDQINSTKDESDNLILDIKADKIADKR